MASNQTNATTLPEAMGFLPLDQISLLSLVAPAAVWLMGALIAAILWLVKYQSPALQTAHTEDNCQPDTAIYFYLITIVFGQPGAFDFKHNAVFYDILDSRQRSLTKSHFGPDLLDNRSRPLVEDIVTKDDTTARIVSLKINRVLPLQDITSVALSIDHPTGQLFVYSVRLQDLGTTVVHLANVKQAIDQRPQTFNLMTVGPVQLDLSEQRPSAKLSLWEIIPFLLFGFNLLLILCRFFIFCPHPCPEYESHLAAVYTALIDGAIASVVVIILLVLYKTIIKNRLFSNPKCLSVKYIFLALLFVLSLAMDVVHFVFTALSPQFLGQVEQWGLAWGIACILVIVFVLLLVSLLFCCGLFGEKNVNKVPVRRQFQQVERDMMEKIGLIEAAKTETAIKAYVERPKSSSSLDSTGTKYYQTMDQAKVPSVSQYLRKASPVEPSKSSPSLKSPSGQLKTSPSSGLKSPAQQSPSKSDAGESYYQQLITTGKANAMSVSQYGKKKRPN